MELLFRGVIQRDLIHAFGPAAGLVLASSVFCAMHIVGRSISEPALVFFHGYNFWLSVFCVSRVLHAKEE